MEEVRRHVMKKGFKISKQHFYHMMRAVVYTGKINVFAQMKTNAEDRFFAKEIDRPTFINASSRYEKEIIRINGRISELSAIHSGFRKYLNEGFPLL